MEESAGREAILQVHLETGPGTNIKRGIGEGIKGMRLMVFPDAIPLIGHPEDRGHLERDTMLPREGRQETGPCLQRGGLAPQED